MPKCRECDKELPKKTKKVIDPFELAVNEKKIKCYLCEDCLNELEDEI